MFPSRNRLSVSPLKALIPVLALAICTRSAVAQSVEQPKPGPEHKQLERWVGKWTYSGEGQSNPFFPAGKFKGELTRQMVLGGFFLEERWEDKNESGYVAQGIILTGHDPAKKSIVQYQFENDGSVGPTFVKIDGNSWEGKGTRTDRKGKPYEVRFEYQLSDDGTTDGGKVEYSSDGGKTWKPWFDIAFKKAAEPPRIGGHMKRATGIGGIFFKAKDAPSLRAWYKRHLGIDVHGWGGAIFDWTGAEGTPVAGTTTWLIDPQESKHFAPSSASFMVNYRVEDLHALVKVLKEEGCNVLEKIVESDQFGKFAWVIDSEGNKVELWQPPAGQ